MKISEFARDARSIGIAEPFPVMQGFYRRLEGNTAMHSVGILSYLGDLHDEAYRGYELAVLSAIHHRLNPDDTLMSLGVHPSGNRNAGLRCVRYKTFRGAIVVPVKACAAGLFQ